MNMKFLIVDDELHICKLIAKFIGDHFMPCSIEFAHSGKEALRYIEEKKPDIVVTDIRIPDFDGIQLVEKAFQAKSSSKFIIVSGYKKFEYAHNALKYGVVDYLIKPIDENELVKVIEGIVKQIANSNTADRKLDAIQQENDRYKQELKINALRNLLDGQPADAHVLDYEKERFMLMVTQICIDPSLSDNQAFFDMAAKNLTGILYAFFTAHAAADVFLYQRRLVTFVNLQPGEEDAVKNAITEAFAAMRRWTKQHSSLNVSTGVSPVWRDGPAGTRENFLLALNAARCHVERGFDGVYWAEDYAGRTNELSPSMVREIQRFERCLEDVQEHQIKGYFSQLLNMIERNPLLHPACLYEIRARIAQIANEYCVQCNLQSAPRLDAQPFCSTATSYDEYFDEMARHFTEFLMEISQQKNAVDSIPVMRAKQYIREHLGEEIRQEWLAEEVHLSVAYFSALFKRVVGCTFSEYIIQERIAAAKKLLINTTLNISEIAVQIGYSDIRAFSKRFKMEVGITPSEFRSVHFDSGIDWWE